MEKVETYEDILLSAFRFLGCASAAEVGAMTLREYRLRMLAFKLRQVDERKKMHEQAYLNQVVQSTDKRGKPKFKTFDEFFDYEKEIDNVLDGTRYERDHINPDTRERILKRIGRLKEYEELKGGNS
ncbi:TPA: hypothetical protein IXN57_000461 [Enterococcus faecium]|nr:hypothetical protein [Enterococcus faecium]HAQ3640970.1 hypothetical protein [Enterococcus faecium]HCU0014004.1 hypothetical protein [Enterococcus faecium]